jgi:biotin carboxyl carrier protein
MFTYQQGDERYTVQLEQLADGSYRATVDEREYVFSAEAIEHGWSLAFPENGERCSAYVTDDGDSRSVYLHGEVYTFTREAERRGRRQGAAGAHGGDVTAQMPGQVREVLVAEGETVKRGQALIILEAMKMELRATAAADGIVRRLLVAAGEVVSRGQLLAQIE